MAFQHFSVDLGEKDHGIAKVAKGCSFPYGLGERTIGAQRLQRDAHYPALVGEQHHSDSKVATGCSSPRWLRPLPRAGLGANTSAWIGEQHMT